ncbi:MAG: BrnT family toxin, partial [Methylobacter sp.]|nr:BrnT family toxin [Methylobacter sp.]
MLEFEWDEIKAERNKKKHSVSFYEATSIFADELSVTFPDPDHSVEENCFIIIVYSVNSSILVVSHTYRLNSIRIISAR